MSNAVNITGIVRNALILLGSPLFWEQGAAGSNPAAPTNQVNSLDFPANRTAQERTGRGPRMVGANRAGTREDGCDGNQACPLTMCVGGAIGSYQQLICRARPEERFPAGAAIPSWRLFSRCLPPRGPLRMLRQAPICCRDLHHLAFRLGIGHLLGLNLRLLREVQPMVHIAFLGRHNSPFFPKVPCIPPPPNALPRTRVPGHRNAD